MSAASSAQIDRLLNAWKQAGFKVITTSFRRTYAEQAAAYAKNPHNAKPGTSKHEHELAIDVNLITPSGKQLMKSSPNEDWINSGAIDIAKKLGFAWGGDFKTYHDPVHFELPWTWTDAKDVVKDVAIKYGDAVVSKGKDISAFIIIGLIALFLYNEE